MTAQRLKKLRAKVGSGRDYDILIGHNSLDDIGEHIKKLKIGTSAFVITSPKIGKLYLRPVRQSLKKHGIDSIPAYVPDGERYKNQQSYNKLLHEIDKFNKIGGNKLFVLNLGGGVICDIGGYVAATFNRGVDYIQVPSTLLAFVDCGIGGKVGINFEKTKNLIGTFRQPRLVFADLNLLKTLNTRELRSGLAEVVKYGVIHSPDLFEFIEDNIDKVFSLDKKTIEKIVVAGYSIKADIVKEDEFDTKDIRIVLNFGHTIGHAIEFASKYAYRHGEAISIGMVCANDISVRLGLLDKGVAARVENLLQKIGLPTRIKNLNINALMKALGKDKKFVNGINRFVMITELGKHKIEENIPDKLIKDVIKKRFAKA